jgi:5-methylcytosine-specific restriction endonuclease McrA
VASKKSTKQKPLGVLAQRRHQVFMRRSYETYKHLAERVAEWNPVMAAIAKKKKQPILPFTLDFMRSAIAEKLNEIPPGEKHAKCPYLPEVDLTVKTFSLDHKVPVSRGGDAAAWANLKICSRSANMIKGELTEDEFLDLLSMMEDGHWPQQARQDLFGRLKAGAAVKRLRFLRR